MQLVHRDCRRRDRKGAVARLACDSRVAAARVGAADTAVGRRRSARRWSCARTTSSNVSAFTARCVASAGASPYDTVSAAAGGAEGASPPAEKAGARLGAAAPRSARRLARAASSPTDYARASAFPGSAIRSILLAIREGPPCLRLAERSGHALRVRRWCGACAPRRRTAAGTCRISISAWRRSPAPIDPARTCATHAVCAGPDRRLDRARHRAVRGRESLIRARAPCGAVPQRLLKADTRFVGDALSNVASCPRLRPRTQRKRRQLSRFRTPLLCFEIVRAAQGMPVRCC